MELTINYLVSVTIPDGEEAVTITGSMVAGSPLGGVTANLTLQAAAGIR